MRLEFLICALKKNIDYFRICAKINVQAEVAELADALRSGRSGHSAREGSSPSFGINKSVIAFRL